MGNKKGIVSFIAAVAALLISSIFITKIAGANSSRRVTQGDVMAIFRASTTGGQAIRFNSGAHEGAPVDVSPASLGAIRPFPPFDGNHYCEEDWHVLYLNIVSGPPDVPDFQSAKDSLNNDVEVEFEVDGIPVELMETGVRPFIPIDRNEPAWVKSFGQIFDPVALEEGAHSFHAKASDNLGEFFENTTTFYIDPAGSGKCLPENR